MGSLTSWFQPSHRFPGANTALPFVNRDEVQLKAVQDFLRAGQIPEGAAIAIVIAAFVTVLLVVFRRQLQVEDVVTRG